MMAPRATVRIAVAEPYKVKPQHVFAAVAAEVTVFEGTNLLRHFFTHFSRFILLLKQLRQRHLIGAPRLVSGVPQSKHCLGLLNQGCMVKFAPCISKPLGCSVMTVSGIMGMPILSR